MSEETPSQQAQGLPPFQTEVAPPLQAQSLSPSHAQPSTHKRNRQVSFSLLRLYGISKALSVCHHLKISPWNGALDRKNINLPNKTFKEP